ncbi:cold-shock protein [Spartinivicinus marinus]|uniref:cold-shock protein n=1 Tax=Spartinivicinus marinus TaxID=2994442 RepID=UPI0025A43EEA|nr:cold-shock protein [Spartinivicinus marinus]
MKLSKHAKCSHLWLGLISLVAFLTSPAIYQSRFSEVYANYSTADLYSLPGAISLLAIGLTSLVLGLHLTVPASRRMELLQLIGSSCFIIANLTVLFYWWQHSTASQLWVWWLAIVATLLHFLPRIHLLKSSLPVLDASNRKAGSVKWFNVSKGFGFISQDNGDDVFVHFKAIRGEGHRALVEGQRVEFLVTTRDKGLQAEDVIPARTEG